MEARRFQSGRNLRKFIIPERGQVDLNANNIMDFIRWDTLSPENISPPPILQNYSDEELTNLSIEDIPNLKCHSQENERAIKDTTFAASNNIGEVKQKQSILCTKKSRMEFPITANKSDFCP